MYNNEINEIKVKLLELSEIMISKILKFILKIQITNISNYFTKIYEKITDNISNNVTKFTQSITNNINRIKNNINITTQFINRNMMDNMMDKLINIFNNIILEKQKEINGGSEFNLQNTDITIIVNNNLCNYLKYLFLVFIIFKEDNFNQIILVLQHLQACYNLNTTSTNSNIYNSLITVDSTFYIYIINYFVSNLNKDNQKYIDRTITNLHNFIIDLFGGIQNNGIDDLIQLLTYLRNIFLVNFKNINHIGLNITDSFSNIKYKKIGNLTFYHNIDNFCSNQMDVLENINTNLTPIPSLYISYTENISIFTTKIDNNDISSFDITQIISLNDILVLLKNSFIDCIIIQNLIYNLLLRMKCDSSSLDSNKCPAYSLWSKTNTYDININYTNLLQTCIDYNISELINNYIDYRESKNDTNNILITKQKEFINKDNNIRIRMANNSLLNIIKYYFGNNSNIQSKGYTNIYSITVNQITENFKNIWYHILDKIITDYISQIVTIPRSFNF